MRYSRLVASCSSSGTKGRAMTTPDKTLSTPSRLHDPLRHFSRDRPAVKLIALVLLVAPRLVTAIAVLAWSFRANGW